MSELICPKSGEPCESAGFCSWKRDTIERGGKTAGDRVAARGPEEVQTAWEDAGHCAEARIEALREVATQPGNPMATIAAARAMASGVEIARDNFPAAHPHE